MMGEEENEDHYIENIVPNSEIFIRFNPITFKPCKTNFSIVLGRTLVMEKILMENWIERFPIVLFFCG